VIKRLFIFVIKIKYFIFSIKYFSVYTLQNHFLFYHFSIRVFSFRKSPDRFFSFIAQKLPDQPNNLTLHTLAEGGTGQMSLVRCFYVFFTALFTALVMVPCLCRWGACHGAADPEYGKKVHTRTIPRVGGIAIGVAFLFSLLMYVDLSREIRGILAGGMILFITGMADDFYGLTAKSKLFAEIAACLSAMAVGRIFIRDLGDLFGTGPVVLPLWIAVPFTVLVVVGIINAINLIDGLDGLAGGISMIALTAFAVHGYLTGNYAVAVTCVALLGGIMGFMKYNLFPARVFMGDSGGLGVGFVIAFLAISLTQAPAAPVSPVIPLVILGLPIMDAVRSMWRRMLKGRNPRSPDMTRVHHRFLNLGFRHRIVVLLICQISLFWAVFTIVFREKPPIVLFSVFVSVSAFFHIVLMYVLRNRERLYSLKKAFSSAICERAFCRKTVGLIGGMTPGIVVLVLLFAVCAILMVHLVLLVRGYCSI
jgi:UDP-GlcNAc:undecaprenyl-phosphate GlcNAc-1-phosphate transferase